MHRPVDAIFEQLSATLAELAVAHKHQRHEDADQVQRAIASHFMFLVRHVDKQFADILARIDAQDRVIARIERTLQRIDRAVNHTAEHPHGGEYE